MTDPSTDLDLLQDHTPGGIYGLWLRVVVLSVLELQEGRFSTSAAESFLFDLGNVFFDFVAERMGYEPEALRERIREALKRSGRERQWRAEIRGER